MKRSMVSLGCAVVMLASCDPPEKRAAAPSANVPSAGSPLRDVPTLAPTDQSSAYAGTIDRSRLDDVLELTRRAFRERDGVLRGGDATAGTEVSARGITITPYGWPHEAAMATEAPIDNAGVVAGAALHLETVRITRGSSTLFSAEGGRKVRLVADGSAEIDTVSATETVRNVDRGLEHAWRFDQAPEGTGDLTVRVAVSGQTYGTRTARGLHFRDHATGLGVAYGDGTWIDAAGSRHLVPAAYADGEIVLTVPDAVVRASRFPAVLDPVVSTEREYDEPILGGAVQTQIEPDIAYSGVSGGPLLIVWSDRRRDTDHLTYTIFAASIDVAGTAAPVAGRVVSDEAGDQRAPAVAWGFRDPLNSQIGRYFVVWHDVGMGTVRGRAVLDAGPPTGIAPSGPPLAIGTGNSPDVAFAAFGGGIDNRFAVTWANAGGTLVLARLYTLDSSNAVQPANIEFNLKAGTFMASPAIASGLFGGGAVPVTDGFLAVWQECWTATPGCTTGDLIDVRGTTIDGDGNLGTWLGVGSVTIGGGSFNQTKPALAFSHSTLLGGTRGFVVAWQQSSVDIKARYVRTNSELAILEPVLTIATGGSTSPAVAGSFTGVQLSPQWLVTWDKATGGITDIYGQTVVASGLSGANFVISNATSNQTASTAVAYKDEGSFAYFVAWADDRALFALFASDIYGSRVTTDGTVVDPAGRLISASANQQETPAIATCLGRSLTVWSDTRNWIFGPDIYGAITDDSGAVLFSDIPIWVDLGVQRNPDVSCNRSTGDFIVVWEIGGQIVGRRVTATGTLLDSSGIQVSSLGHPSATTKTQPAVAFESGVYLVTYTDSYYTAFGYGDVIVGVRVDAATGALIDKPTIISGMQLGWHHRNADVTYDEAFAPTLPEHRRFFVVWELRDTSGVPEIFSRYVLLDGTLPPAWIPVTGTTIAETNPSVATRPATSGQDRFHVVAFEQTLTTNVRRLLGFTVTSSGTLGSVAVLGFSGLDNFDPQIANRTPDRFVLTYWINWGSDPTFDFGVYGQDLAASSPSTLSLLSSFAISTSAQIRERNPSVSCATQTRCEVPYRKYDDDPDVGVDRVKFRLLTY